MLFAWWMALTMGAPAEKYQAPGLPPMGPPSPLSPPPTTNPEITPNPPKVSKKYELPPSFVPPSADAPPPTIPHPSTEIPVTPQQVPEIVPPVTPTSTCVSNKDGCEEGKKQVEENKIRECDGKDTQEGGCQNTKVNVQIKEKEKENEEIKCDGKKCEEPKEDILGPVHPGTVPGGSPKLEEEEEEKIPPTSEVDLIVEDCIDPVECSDKKRKMENNDLPKKNGGAENTSDFSNCDGCKDAEDVVPSANGGSSVLPSNTAQEPKLQPNPLVPNVNPQNSHSLGLVKEMMVDVLSFYYQTKANAGNIVRDYAGLNRKVLKTTKQLMGRPFVRISRVVKQRIQLLRQKLNLYLELAEKIRTGVATINANYVAQLKADVRQHTSEIVAELNSLALGEKDIAKRADILATISLFDAELRKTMNVEDSQLGTDQATVKLNLAQNLLSLLDPKN